MAGDWDEWSTSWTTGSITTGSWTYYDDTKSGICMGCGHYFTYTETCHRSHCDRCKVMQSKYRKEDIKALIEMMAELEKAQEVKRLTKPKEEKMSLLTKLKKLTLPKDEKLLRKYGVVDEAGNLTDEGIDVVLDKIFETVRKDVVADLEKLDSEEKKSRKK